MKNFYEECRDIMDNEDIYGLDKFFVEALLATSEFDTFMYLIHSEMAKFRRHRK